jgi:hypothetical protein
MAPPKHGSHGMMRNKQKSLTQLQPDLTQYDLQVLPVCLSRDVFWGPLKLAAV